MCLPDSRAPGMHLSLSILWLSASSTLLILNFCFTYLCPLFVLSKSVSPGRSAGQSAFIIRSLTKLKPTNSDSEDLSPLPPKHMTVNRAAGSSSTTQSRLSLRIGSQTPGLSQLLS